MNVKHWLFDLDDTLYPAQSGLFPLVSRRITDHISGYLNLPWDEARTLQKQYWKEHGTSLRGMILHHGMDPEPFLRYVHDVPVEDYLQRDERVRALLLRGAGRRHVFTNSPAEYAERVLEALDLADLFENIFDIRHAQYVPKPNALAYQKVLDHLAEPGPACAMIDDSPQNLVAAQAWGIKTIWLRSPQSEANGLRPDLTIDSLLDLDL